MVILGGLELAVGGYLVHRHYKNKNEKKRFEQETQQRRHHTFPGARPQSCPQDPQPQPQPPPDLPPRKVTYHTPQNPPPRQPYYQPQFKHDARPHPITHTQSFNIPRRPLPQQAPQIIQPLQRADSCATISRMPIANGYRPSGVNGGAPAMPSRRHAPTLSPIPQSPYSNGRFSVSTPALAVLPIKPTTPLYGTGLRGGGQTVDDNWETYAGQGGGHYAPSVSTALGEYHDPDEPPPPYHP
ncbi:hypothetical protein P280DRAFT_474776 [Massarina eburnea CBS 473.64]|uniref:Uncharacterized protein n=1 Tax=Massarina eburnea CBS 473.64 TaxID=1395130 RepID=A0A6A6RJU8_9PLEO|nr:hypothetical protein P280DRAFT_474776 [Massarina eburnea CBS 473.64]